MLPLMLSAVAIGLVVLMLVQAMRQTVSLLSIRNLYLLGFIVYQLISPIGLLLSDTPPPFTIANPGQAGVAFLGYLAVFLPIFFLAYHKSLFWKWAANRVVVQPKSTPDMTLMMIALLLTPLGFAIRVVLSNIPGMGLFALQSNIALSAAACCIVGWVWSQRRFNLAVVVLGLMVFGLSISTALLGAFGRRPLLTVVMGLVWGTYHRLSQRMNLLPLLFWSAPFVLIAGGLVAGFTGFRGKVAQSLTPREFVSKLFDTDNIQKGVGQLFAGQQVGSGTFWCIENYPQQHQYRHLHSVKYFFYLPYPRAWWQNKPYTLANELASLADVKGVNKSGITLPPGVIGYAAAEGGLYAAAIYALIFGGLTRFFDQLIRNNSMDVFVVTACGCASGQFIGLARGDLANFTFLVVVNTIFAFASMWVIRAAIGRRIEQQVIYWTGAPMPPDTR